MKPDEVKKLLQYEIVTHHRPMCDYYELIFPSERNKPNMTAINETALIEYIVGDVCKTILDKIIEIWDDSTYEEYFVCDAYPYLTAYKMIKEDINSIIKYSEI